MENFLFHKRISYTSGNPKDLFISLRVMQASTS
jgi:hypothetical protein